MIQTLLSCLIFGVIAEEFYGKSSRVENLLDSNFQDKVINSDEMWIVEFYAPWCGHCQQLKPSYEKAAKALQGVVRVGAVNMDEQK